MSSPWKPEQKFSLVDEVLLQRFEDEALLLNLGSERVYQLNDTGAHLVELLSAGHTFAAILSVLKEAYTDSPHDIESQVAELIAELMKEKLIIPIVG